MTLGGGSVAQSDARSNVVGALCCMSCRQPRDGLFPGCGQGQPLARVASVGRSLSGHRFTCTKCPKGSTEPSIDDHSTIVVMMPIETVRRERNRETS